MVASRVLDWTGNSLTLRFIAHLLALICPNRAQNHTTLESHDTRIARHELERGDPSNFVPHIRDASPRVVWVQSYNCSQPDHGSKGGTLLTHADFRTDTTCYSHFEPINRQGAEVEKAFVPCSPHRISFWCRENFEQQEAGPTRILITLIRIHGKHLDHDRRNRS
jgi:hypothetical protein